MPGYDQRFRHIPERILIDHWFAINISAAFYGLTCVEAPACPATLFCMARLSLFQRQASTRRGCINGQTSNSWNGNPAGLGAYPGDHTQELVYMYVHARAIQGPGSRTSTMRAAGNSGLAAVGGTG